jgi:3-methyladenine DNA glycosylase AlkD
MIPNNWNSKSYKEFVDYLISIKDEKYKEFHSGLCLNCKYEILGIRLPILRKIAKDISKTNIEEFLKISNDKYYEEVMIQGLVISQIKDEKLFYHYFKNHINKIDNWALCDTFCNSIKIVKDYEDKYFKEALELSLSPEEFISRVGLIIILEFFIKEENLEKIFDTLNKIQTNKYYINMAEAWLVCEIYTKYPKQTLKFIKNNNLNKFTHNKSISKIHDSYRVSAKEKEYLNTLKRK